MFYVLKNAMQSWEHWSLVFVNCDFVNGYWQCLSEPILLASLFDRRETSNLEQRSLRFIYFFLVRDSLKIKNLKDSVLLHQEVTSNEDNNEWMLPRSWRVKHARKPNFPITYVSSWSRGLMVIESSVPLFACQSGSFFVFSGDVGWGGQSLFWRAVRKTCSEPWLCPTLWLGCPLLEFISKIQPEVRRETGIRACSLKHYLTVAQSKKNKVVGQQ